VGCSAYLCTLFKSAFVTIIGLPNVGKSTLLNAILGEDLVITNPKAQTTRHRIKGIHTTDSLQLVFSDTPGIIKDPAYKLQAAMMGNVDEALEDADIVLLLLDGPYPRIEEFKAVVQNIKVPLVVVLNKIDQVQDQDALEKHLEEAKVAFKTEHVLVISALEQFNVDSVVSVLEELAPEHPPYYPLDIITDENVRFIVSEMIREQILTQFKKEIPYSTEVVVTDYKEEKKLDRIECTVYVERDSQKIILLGKKGAAIKKLGTEARKKIEAFIHKKVFLGLTIKVRKDWRKDEQELKRFGYLK
jgi:GTP-binding protein Era